MTKVMKTMASYFLANSQDPLYWDHHELRDAVQYTRDRLGLSCFRGMVPQDIAYSVRCAVIGALCRQQGGTPDGITGDVGSLT